MNLFKNFINYILWIPKILVQFCYLRLYISTDLSSARQRIQSRMDMPAPVMDWNLKKLGPLFQDLTACKNHQKIYYGSVRTDEVCLIYFLQLYRSISCMENPGGLLNKCLYGEAPPRGPTPYPFIHYFSRKRYHFRIKQPVVAFRRSPNLRDILVRAKLANIDNTSKPPASSFR